MKILITGSRGFVGSNLSSFLRSHGHEVIDFEGSVEQKDVITLNFVQDFDAVIHLAAYGNDSSHDQSTTQGVIRTIETNLIGTSHLINEFIRSKAKLFIFAGSSSEYGEQPRAMSIYTPLDGKNLYATTKSAISNILSHLTSLEDKQFRVIRLFSVYGEHEKHNRLIPTAFRCAIDGKTMPLGEGVHDFVHISDVCETFLHVLTNPDCPPVIHAATGIQYSNAEVIKLVEEVTGKKIHTKTVEKLRTFDTQCWVSDRDSIVVKPKLSFKQGLEQIWSTLKK